MLLERANPLRSGSSCCHSFKKVERLAKASSNEGGGGWVIPWAWLRIHDQKYMTDIVTALCFRYLRSTGFTHPRTRGIMSLVSHGDAHSGILGLVLAVITKIPTISECPAKKWPSLRQDCCWTPTTLMQPLPWRGVH